MSQNTGNEPLEGPHTSSGAYPGLIWTNTTTDGKRWYSTTACRMYKDQKRKWQNAASFEVDDLLVLSELLKSAWAKCFEFRAKSPKTGLTTGPGRAKEPEATCYSKCPLASHPTHVRWHIFQERMSCNTFDASRTLRKRIANIASIFLVFSYDCSLAFRPTCTTMEVKVSGPPPLI